MNSSQTYETISTVQTETSTQRASFIRNTYLHVAGAIVVFGLLTAAILSSPLASIFASIAFASTWSWLIILLVFAGISTLAQRWANSDTSKPVQYLGLGLYVIAEAIIFTPILLIAQFAAPGVIELAGFLTLFLFAGLTTVAFVSGTDFSFLKGFLTMGFFLALGVILGSVFLGPIAGTLSIVFSSFMIIFAAAAILYQTSNIIRTYRSDQYVAASLALFASVALLFWYIINLILNLTSKS